MKQYVLVSHVFQTYYVSSLTTTFYNLAVEFLKPYDKKATEILIRNMRDDESWAVKLFFDRRFGKAIDYMDITVDLYSALSQLMDMSNEQKNEILKDLK